MVYRDYGVGRALPVALPVVLVLGAVVAASGAQAQFGGGMGSKRNGGLDRNRSDSATARDNRAHRPANGDFLTYEQVEYQLTLLEESLKLAPEQKPGWQAFAARVRSYAADQARERAQGAAAPSISTLRPTAPQHLARAVDEARNRLAALEDVEAAAKSFYPVLDPTQRAIVDLRVPTIVAPRPGTAAGALPGASSPRP